MNATPVRAAQYLRMSTEHQRYSLQNQQSGIARYASENGLTVIETYADPGRSGLTLKQRPELQRLLHDVLRAERSFDVVLVFDVSRWGRFQDPDQSAHYEFICRQAGVPVVYCAEPFENDGRMVSNLVKQLKRLMAGEYSRELSAKHHVAHMHRIRQHRLFVQFFQSSRRIVVVHAFIVCAMGGRARPRR